MIRYNANSPEILGKKQYDVLRGFGRWCVFVGICAANFLFLMFVKVAGRSPFWIQGGWAAWWMPILLLSTIFCATYFFMLGIGNISRMKNTCFIASFGKLGLGVVAIVAFLATVYFISVLHWLGYEVLFLIASIYILCLLVAGFYWGIIKTYKEDHVIKWFNKDNEQSAVSNLENSEPDYVVIFEKWNPLQYYGKLWKLAGYLISMFTLAIFLVEGYAHSYRNISEALMVVVPITAAFIVAAVIGHGLSRQKEWARMMMILLHCAIILLVAIAVYSLITTVDLFRYASWPALTLMMFLFSIAYWCYFVNRTLSSPVVKYVCLRGGHDID